MDNSSFVSGSMVSARNENGVNFGTPSMPVVFTALMLTMPSHLQFVVFVLALVMHISLALTFSIKSIADSLTQLICAPESTSMDLGIMLIETAPENMLFSWLPLGR